MLKDHKINLDQLLVIHNAMKYPITYVQGPPGTGKTATILNLILTAFFNGRTVLFCSHNNHPIDLDGKEHFEDEIVRQRDRKKDEICREHHMELIRVENAYARRYNHIKVILENYFKRLK